MAAKSNRKKFLELVRVGQCKKVERMLEQGLDPNFITEDGSGSGDLLYCSSHCMLPHRPIPKSL